MLVEGQEGADDVPAIVQGDAQTVLYVFEQLASLPGGLRNSKWK